MNSEAFKDWCRSFASHPSARCSKPLMMGVLNVTPDSFSDGGQYLTVEKAFLQAMKMVEDGADIIDIGGESTKPGASVVALHEEMMRVIPVIERLRAESDICISIDTYKAQVMREAIAAGATFVNDIMALKEPNALEAVVQLDVPVCLMHMKGQPSSMQDNPHYALDVVNEIDDFFNERMAAVANAGFTHKNVLLDPGIGFGKTVQHNLQILNRLREFHHHQRPLLIGVSRKSFLGAILQKKVTERLIGGIAASVFAALQGVAIIRTHDVSETLEAMQMVEAIVHAS